MSRFLNWLFNRKPVSTYQHVYLLMIEYADGTVKLAATGRSNNGDKLVVATEENKYLFHRLGAGLMSEGLIIGYQVVRTDGPPVRTYLSSEVPAVEVGTV